MAAMARDPGFQLKWQCRVVAGWDRALADGLARAEAFGLSPEAGERTCRRSISRVPGPESCESFIPHPALPCGHLWEDTCLLLPPRCAGPCPDFREGEGGG